MRRIGLVVTDLDGTILRPDGSFSDATRRTFQHLRAAGIPAAFATARFHTRELARELGVPYMIRTDGTLISDAAGRVLHRRHSGQGPRYRAAVPPCRGAGTGAGL